MSKKDQRQFDLCLGVKRGREGQDLAADNRVNLLREARRIARHLGQRERLVSADDVYEFMLREGLPADELGNAAGSIFRGEEWRFTGLWRKSRRVSNHGRAIRVWRYEW